jgi:O-antigen/teichoic acid export membrane protein
MGLIRPSVIVRYHADSSFADLNRRIVLVLKLSFGVWAALATFFVVAGEPIVGLLSAGKYRDGYGLLIGFVGILAIQDLKRVVILVTNTLRRSDLLRRAGVVYLIAVPIAFALVAAGAGFYGLLLGMILAELGVVFDVVRRLRALGFKLDFDLDGQLRIFAAAAVAAVVGAVAVRLLPGGDGLALLCSVLALPAYVLVLWWLRPLRAGEQAAIERLLNRKLSWL